MEILSTLKQHGYDNPVASKYLEEATNLPGPAIRSAIRELRNSGEPIGSDDRGYYYCHSREELQRTIDHLRSRVESLSVTYHSLAKIFPQTIPLFPEGA